jgi:sigma-B regulation protein RsbU (phosphoserine phosphatase)
MEAMNYSLTTTNRNLIETRKKVEDRTHEIEHREEELRKLLDRLRQDLQLAKTIQQKIMPGDTWKLERIMIDIRYMPLIEIGGDIFDVLQRDDGSTRVFLADATGHGIVAALITMLIKSEYEKVKEKIEDPFMILSKLNEFIPKFGNSI